MLWLYTDIFSTRRTTLQPQPHLPTPTWDCPNADGAKICSTEISFERDQNQIAWLEREGAPNPPNVPFPDPTILALV